VLIDDVAEIAARVIYRRSSGALNVATGRVASFREIADHVDEKSLEKFAEEALRHSGHAAALLIEGAMLGKVRHHHG